MRKCCVLDYYNSVINFFKERIKITNRWNYTEIVACVYDTKAGSKHINFYCKNIKHRIYLQYSMLLFYVVPFLF